MKIIAAAGVLCAIQISQVFGAVTFTSRVSTAIASRSNAAPPDNYNESGTFNMLGASTITLPHGFSHQSTVTNAGISGQWNGSTDISGGSNVTTATKSTLDALFTVGPSGMNATITLSGGANNIILDAGTNPLLQNAYFVITNATTNAIVFDAFAHGVQTVIPQNDYSSIAWANVVKNITLAAGDYRVRIGADGDVQQHPGPGAGFFGNASLTAGMTFSEIPAPGSVMVLAGLLGLSVRRKR